MALPQTHKAIIFEKFDDENNTDLYTILNNNPVGDQLVRGLEKLTVHTFDEFMKKFAPKVYEVVGRDRETGSIKFFYTTDPTRFKGCPVNPVDIGDHEFYKMLSKLYSERGASGQANFYFNDEEILEMLTPKKTLDDTRDIRKKIEYNLQLYHEAKARGDKGEMKSASNNVKDCRKKIAGYATSSLNKLLPILIDDTKKKLELLGTSAATDGSSQKKLNPPVDFGTLYLNEAGQLDVDTSRKTVPALAAPKDSDGKNTALVVQGNGSSALTVLPADAQTSAKKAVPDKLTLQTQIAETVMKDYDVVAKNPNEQIRSLIVSTFAPLSTVTETDEKIDAKELIARQKGFMETYTNAIKSFATEMSRIVESLLGVKAFFDHATVEGGKYSEVPGGVIIANCKASKLLKIRDKFKGYMKNFGKETGDARIWFAVVPNVLQEPPERIIIDVEDDNPLGDDLLEDPLGGDMNDSKSVDEDYVSISAVKDFLGIMNEAKIMTVFNVRVKNNNTFDDLSAAEVEDKIKTFDPCNYAHAVYAYPNFTLMKEKIFKPLKDLDCDTEITLPQTLIDAAYPTAGLLVASQQPKVLESRKLKYDRNAPCVGVDFEDVRIKKKLPTKFNRESVFQRGGDVKKVINEKMFGFNFSGDEVKDEDGTWKNSYVHCARTLAKLKNSDLYKPIYQTLTEDFIAQQVDLLPSKKKTFVKKFIERLNRECVDKNNQTSYADCVNLLLRADEEIRLVDDGNKIKLVVHFAGGDSYVDVEVESD